MAPRATGAYHVGVVCALPKEMLAVRAMLDEEHELPRIRDAQDTNNYVLGRVHNHNVVVVCLPTGVYGTHSAATVASNLLRTFPGIRFGLMVGIGGGIPGNTDEYDLRLGDVVVSKPDGVHGGVVQYDLGKDLGPGKFERKGILRQPPTILLTALSSMQAQPGTTRRQIARNLSAVMQRADQEDTGFQFPGVDQDRLACGWCDRSEWPLWWYTVWVLLFWLGPLWSCRLCDQGRIYRPIDRVEVRVYYGTIASGNVLLKNRVQRDRLRNEHGAICVEMEAAGLMNEFPCLVIRGICDYADSHKNDVWQKYAAVTAAAVAKTLLLTVRPIEVHRVPCATDVMESGQISYHHTNELLAQGSQHHREGTEEHLNQSQAPESPNLAERRRQCHQTFKRHGSYEEYKNINPLRIAGTCQWVLNHPHYKAWQQSTADALLWISADPGCGKSVFARSLVDMDLIQARRHSVCYFFFKDNPNQDNLCSALCAILHQLFYHQPSLLHHALPAWDRNKDKLQQESEEMWRILLTAAADLSAQPIICILDALDECWDDDRRQLIDKLCKFCPPSSSSGPGLKLKFLVTSRPYDSVQRWFEQTVSRLPEIRLRGEEESDQINKEINLVIDHRVDELAVEFDLPESSDTSLRGRLKGMKHRTYLWLYLAYEEIRATFQAMPSNDKMEVESLPAGIEDAYERILAKIHSKHKTLARRILMIIVGARRPLEIKEMALALGAARVYQSDQSDIEPFDHERLARNIRQVCGLFVFFNHSHLFLIHQTAKEFLLAQTPTLDPTIVGWRSSFYEADVQAEMARLCITYLHVIKGSDGTTEFRRNQDRVPEEPHNIELSMTEARKHFFQYCAVHWASHLSDDTIAKDMTLRAKARFLYVADSSLFHAWFRFHRPELYQKGSWPTMLPQHVVCMNGHSSILQELMDAPEFKLNARNSTGKTALHWAAIEGHAKLVQQLLNKSADLDNPVDAYGDALQVASYRGHEKVVQMLLDGGASVDAGRGRYGSALQTASYTGHEKAVELLLDRGADVDAPAGPYGDALQTAAFAGHESAVQQLLDRGANVNAPAGPYGNALQAASYQGHKKVVHLLLQNGADIDARQGRHGSALQEASFGGHQEVVQLLLDSGADVNAQQQGFLNNALQAASFAGHEGIVQLLFSRGASINAYGGADHSALQVASCRGHVKVVQLLLDMGADVNAEGGRHGNALQAALSECHEVVATLLSAAGARRVKSH